MEENVTIQEIKSRIEYLNSSLTMYKNVLNEMYEHDKTPNSEGCKMVMNNIDELENEIGILRSLLKQDKRQAIEVKKRKNVLDGQVESKTVLCNLFEVTFSNNIGIESDNVISFRYHFNENKLEVNVRDNFVNTPLSMNLYKFLNENDEKRCSVQIKYFNENQDVIYIEKYPNCALKFCYEEEMNRENPKERMFVLQFECKGGIKFLDKHFNEIA